MKAKRKKTVYLTRQAAASRMDAMLDLIAVDVRGGVKAHAVLSSGNKIVGKMPTKTSPIASIYNSITRALILELTMTVARVYDHGSINHHRNKKDVASIPLFFALLNQKRCQHAAISGAIKTWKLLGLGESEIDKRIASQRSAIAECLEFYRSTLAPSKVKSKFQKVKQIRDKELAHTLLTNGEWKRPTHAELDELLAAANDFVKVAVLACGKNYLIQDGLLDMPALATDFWEKALDASEHVAD